MQSGKNALDHALEREEYEISAMIIEYDKSVAKPASGSDRQVRMTHARIENILHRMVEKDPQELDDKEEHLPEVLLRVSTDDKSFWWKLVPLFVFSSLIQALQVYITFLLMDDDAKIQLVEWTKFIYDKLLESSTEYNANDPNALFYKEVDFLPAFKNDAHLTEEGLQTSMFNIVIGMALLLGFLSSELDALLRSNEYHFMDRMTTWRHVARTFLGWIVLIGQITIVLVVTSACVGSIITSSLDTTKTVEASIAAFFVLEIDDKLVPVVWPAIPYDGATSFCQ